MSMGGGGKGGGGSTSTPESQQLAGMAGRFEQEGRGTRERSLDSLAGILNYGADYNYPAASTEPKTYSRADITNAYNKYDIGKGQDVNRIIGDMPGDRFTLEQLRSGANTGGLSNRSNMAWNSATGELERMSQRPGPGGPGGGMMPLVQTAMDRSRAAIGNTARGLTDQYGNMGSADNPFFQRNMAQAGTLADQQTNAIAPRITEQFLTNVMPLAFNQSGAAQGALSGAAKSNADMMAGNQAASAQSGAQTMQTVGQIAGLIAMAAMMT